MFTNIGQKFIQTELQMQPTQFPLSNYLQKQKMPGSPEQALRFTGFFSSVKAKLIKPQSMQSGLTLIELLIVIVIMAVLTGLAVPSFQEQSRQQRVEGAAEGLVAALQNAKAEAITTNSSKTIVITSTGTVCTGTNCASVSNAVSDWCYGMTKATDATCDCTSAGSCAAGSVVSNNDFTGIGITFNTSKSRKFESLRGTATSGTIRFFTDNKSLGVTTTTTGRIRICKDSASKLSSYTDSGACP